MLLTRRELITMRDALVYAIDYHKHRCLACWRPRGVETRTHVPCDHALRYMELDSRLIDELGGQTGKTERHRA